MNPFVPSSIPLRFGWFAKQNLTLFYICEALISTIMVLQKDTTNWDSCNPFMIPVDVVPRVSAGRLVIGIWIGQSWPQQDYVRTIFNLRSSVTNATEVRQNARTQLPPVPSLPLFQMPRTTSAVAFVPFWLPYRNLARLTESHCV